MKKIGNFLFSFTPFLCGMALQFVIVFYFMFLASFTFPLLVPNGNLDNLWIDLDFNTLLSIVWSVTCSVFFGIWYYRSCGGDYKLNLKKDFHPLQLAGLVVLVPATQLATSVLIGIISTIFPQWLEDYQELMESAGMGNDISILMMIYSVCLAPFSEEFIFRGVTMRLARRAFPFWFANILQAFLFGVFHMNMLQGCYAFALGLILGYVCEKGGSIYYSILFHFLYNLWGTTSSWMNALPEAALSALVLLGTFVLLPAGFVIFRQGINKKEQNF